MSQLELATTIGFARQPVALTIVPIAANWMEVVAARVRDARSPASEES